MKVEDLINWLKDLPIDKDIVVSVNGKDSPISRIDYVVGDPVRVLTTTTGENS